MRVIHAAALTAAALVLGSVASAQGLGDVAAREREKRKAEPAKPAKVYTEGDIGRSMTPAKWNSLPVFVTARSAGRCRSGLASSGKIYSGFMWRVCGARCPCRDATTPAGVAAVVN